MQTASPLTLPAPEPATVPDSPVRRPKFPADDGFQTTLKNRVDEYFRQTGKRPRDCWQMYLKTAVILTWVGVSYFLLVFVAEHWWQALPLAVSLAMAMSAIGFSIQHDGGHKAYSRFRWVNSAAARSLDLMGASSYLWYWKHSVFHHTYSNVPGVDTDVELGPAIRIHDGQKLRWFHRWQHIYLFGLYTFTSVRWHLWGDFKEVATGYMGPHKIPRPRGWDWVVFVGGKAFSMVTFFVVPMLFHDWYTVLGFYALVVGLMGVIMSIVFQLAHCVGEAEYPKPDPETNRLERGFAAHQVETTVDFAQKSKFLCWWLGGLNFQIEHHLFPKICHIHYPAIAKIVETTSREYGVKYHVEPTFFSGLRSHYRYLKKMGRAEAVAV
ncbi:MAG TPA: acyl-CoA desaturase [Gemmataceae bacterium]|jgi:linoleoyl-CoA desaturase|nr:acyl-CoA desaturase [Gemmataceae bacterium]